MTNGRILTCHDCNHYNPENLVCDLGHIFRALINSTDGVCVDFSRHPEKSYCVRVCCEVCGELHRPGKSLHYIARDKSSTGALDALTKREDTTYDAYDCPYCGAQMIAQERKPDAIEPDAIEEQTEVEESRDDEEGGEGSTAFDWPQPGEHIQFCGQEWVALGVEQGGLLVIKAEPLPEEMPFDEGGFADWRKSSLRKYLNGKYLDSLGDTGDALLEFESDLKADDGIKDYGTCKDKVFLLSDALYRKYREYISEYDKAWWTITPWSPYYSNKRERIVYTSGALNYYYADNTNGIVPSLCLNLSSIGGAESDATAERA